MIFILFLMPFAFIGIFLAWFALGLFQKAHLKKPFAAWTPRLPESGIRPRMEDALRRWAFWRDFGKS